MANLPSLFGGNNSTSNPFRDLAKMQRQMTQMFDDMWNNVPSMDLDVAPLVTPLISPLISAPAFVPACDVTETDTHMLISLDVPGIKKDDINVSLRDSILTISGQRKEEHEEKGKNTYSSECYYGSFQRAFQVPSDVKADQIETHYADGVLKIAVPIGEASKAQQIKIGEAKPGFWERFHGSKKLESKSGSAQQH